MPARSAAGMRSSSVRSASHPATTPAGAALLAASSVQRRGQSRGSAKASRAQMDGKEGRGT
eukprot:3805226-Pyramimonas_sp.AAC.1